MRIFVAGASGSVGFEVVRLAKTRGDFIRTLSRQPENARKLEGLADHVVLQDASAGVPGLEGIDTVVSVLGGSVAADHPEKRSYRAVDFLANIKLLEAARAAGVRRFLYVSAHIEAGYRDTAYIRAHEEFVEVLRRTGLSYTVVRPTGIYPALSDFVRLARRGLGTVIGDGRSRTNPVHQQDVARTLVDLLDSGPAEISVGGPETLTRREIAELAFHVLGKQARIIHVPARVFRAGAKVVALWNPRLGELLDFAAAVSTTDCVAPARGRLRLEDYFRTIANN